MLEEGAVKACPHMHAPDYYGAMHAWHAGRWKQQRRRCKRWSALQPRKSLRYLSSSYRSQPSPIPCPTDPVPAGPRTVGRPYTRHLARKLGAPDGQHTGGTHTPAPSPYSACA